MPNRRDLQLVFAISLIGIAAMLYAAWSAQGRIRSWQDAFTTSNESPTYLAASLLLEHHRFLDAAIAYVNARDDVTHGELLDRLDIYWSRHDLLASHERLFHLPLDAFSTDDLPPDSHTPAIVDSLSTLLDTAEATLRQIESRLIDLEPGDRTTLQSIQSALHPMSSAIGVLQVNSFERDRYLDGIQRTLSEKLNIRLRQAYVGVGLGIALIALVLTTCFRQKLRNTAALESVNAKLRSEVEQSSRLADELEHRATHDALSGLTNRTGFNDVLGELLTSGEGSHGLCFIDLDLFKIVNDTCGHAAGDQLIRRAGELLGARCPERGTVARFGGDEFVLLVPECDGRSFARLVQDCCEDLHPLRFDHGARRFDITASFGATLFDAGEHSITSLLEVVDAACYEAKRAGGARVHFADDDGTMIEARRLDLEWIGLIGDALSEDRFRLYHQPIVSLSAPSGSSPPSSEILVRMIDRDGRSIAPGTFLEIAERYSLASRIDRWVVRETFAWLNANAESLPFEQVNINLSGRSVGDRDFLRFIEEVSATLDVDTRHVCFEITESAIVGKHACECLTRLGELGYRLALDDFGTGFSSFGYLSSLPVDYIKLDGLFVRDIDTNATHREFVRAMGVVGRAMGKRTVAEYVQNEASREILTELGIDFGQGFHFARPEPLALAVARYGKGTFRTAEYSFPAAAAHLPEPLPSDATG